MPRLCRLVPLLGLCAVVSLPVLVAGCFDNHGRIDGDDGGAIDAGTGETDAGRPGPPDSGPRRDAGSCGFLLTDDRATSACLRPDGSGVVPPGVAYELPIRLEGCFCTHQLRCEASIRDPFSLELTTTVCDEGADCDGCVDGIETTCALPPLVEGTWLVTVNGQRAFDLPVEVPTPGFLPVDRCWDFASPVGDGLVCPWPGEPFSPAGEENVACIPSAARPTDRVEVRIADPCATCFLEWGACRVEITGSEIRVSPTERACDCPTCGACPEVCMLAEHSCHLPPLEVGEYQVYVDGARGPSTLRIADEPPPPEELCVPGR